MSRAMPRYFALFGGLHIEKAMLVAHGNLIRGSGLEDLLGDKQIETIGLYVCLKAVYAQSNSDMPIFEWVNEIAKDNLLKYWLVILNFQIDYLVFVKSIKGRQVFALVNVLKSLVKWFFIFDQYNYSRWISVHLQDLLTFVAGNFAAQITGRQFSRIHFDQAHEQSNKTIKSISGPIHFVNRSDENLPRRWEIADFLDHVECELKGSNSSETQHHEDSPSHNVCKGKFCYPISFASYQPFSKRNVWRDWNKFQV